jgi:hypothetical protein
VRRLRENLDQRTQYRTAHGRWLALVLPLTMSGFGFPQAEPKSGNLIVNGHPGQAPLTQINGHPYVAVDALAQLMNGSLSYQGKSNHTDAAVSDR